MTGLPIIQYWHAKSPPDYIEEMLTTFRERNPGMSHRVFSEADADAFIGQHFGPRELAAFRACAVPAMQADYFRYCAVLVLGGVYCDADERCVGDLSQLVPPPGGGQLFMRPGGRVVNGLFAFGAPGHPALELTLEIATVNIERRNFDRVYASTGPALFTTLFWLRRLGSIDLLIERASHYDLDRYTRAYCQAIGDCGRGVAAFAGVRVSPFARYRDFVQPASGPLPYKSTAEHWFNTRKIFR